MLMDGSDNRKRWAVVALVFLFMLINFADKAVVGLSSVPIMQELRLSHAQFGLLGSAFFLLFSISGVAVGFLANHVRTKTLMGVMGTVWALALWPVSAISSLAVLVGSRVVLGAAEGPAFPVALHAVYKWFGDRHRAVPTSVVASGAAFGAGIVAPLITWIIVHYGWHAAFGTLSVVGALWVCLWVIFGEEGPIDRPAAMDPGASPPIPYARLLCSRTAVGVFLGGFAAYWVIALNIVWLANYLIKARHMLPAEAAWVIALPSLLQMAFAPACAFLSQYLAQRGVSSRISRGVLGALCVIISGASMICLPLQGMGPLQIALIGLSFSIGGVFFTLGSALIGEISPASQRGAMLGMTNSIHTLAGLCAPVAMGLLVDVNVNPTAGFRTAFLYAGVFVVILGVAAALLIDPESDLMRFRRIAAVDRKRA
jgi:MFS family permease